MKDPWSLSWLTLIYERYLWLTISSIYHSLISSGWFRPWGNLMGAGGWSGGGLSLTRTPTKLVNRLGRWPTRNNPSLWVKIGSLSNNEGDGYENRAKKVNSRYFKLYRAYSNSSDSSNVGNLFFSGDEFQKTVPKFRKRKRKSLSCVHFLKNVKLGTFTL